jgi:hypothetical protein
MLQALRGRTGEPVLIHFNDESLMRLPSRAFALIVTIIGNSKCRFGTTGSVRIPK